MQPTPKEYLFVSGDLALVKRLNELVPEGIHFRAVKPNVASLRQAWADQGLAHVFFDFFTVPQNALMSALVRDFSHWDVNCQRVAVGCSDSAQIVLDALRAGVHEFVNLNQPESIADEVLRITSQAIQPAKSNPSLYPHVMLVGARAGVGTSTLAASLAYVMQRQINQGISEAVLKEPASLALKQRVCVVDLGWPVGDATLYLKLSSDFTFIQAASERHRLDHTMLSTALAQHSSGLCALSLPSDQRSLQQLNGPDTVSLGAYLRTEMANVVIDGGGFPNEQILQDVQQAGDALMIVVDQSLSALVALADYLARRTEQLQTKRPKLIVNQYDSRYGLPAEAIAKRFDLELLAVLPDRRLEHARSSSMGQLLVQTHEKDSYTSAVQALSQALLSPKLVLGVPEETSLWGQLKRKVMSR